MQNYDQRALDEALWVNLNLLDEIRAKAHLNDLTYKRIVAKVFNHKVQPRHLSVGDLV
ncbi:hypothetical protein BHE74_00027816 [Ensete ventricosum]|nr:hypothetical protein BHE74_00027816 [Ensete ventricosum]RZS05719.1 hypothetical protein BHM03_00036263 [Ensete ventricosum]